MVSSERASQGKKNGTNFSSSALSSEELRVRKENPQTVCAQCVMLSSGAIGDSSQHKVITAHQLIGNYKYINGNETLTLQST